MLIKKVFAKRTPVMIGQTMVTSHAGMIIDNASILEEADMTKLVLVDLNDKEAHDYLKTVGDELYNNGNVTDFKAACIEAYDEGAEGGLTALLELIGYETEP